MKIITDENLIETFEKQILQALNFPSTISLDIQTLYCFNATNGCFYISQCMIFYSSVGGITYSIQSPKNKLEFKLVGIADLTFDLGRTILRPKTIGDALSGLFSNNTIKFKGNSKFNKKYYLSSNKKNDVRKIFNEEFIDSIARYSDILLIIYGKTAYLTFNSFIEESQRQIIENVFSNCKFIVNS